MLFEIIKAFLSDSENGFSSVHENESTSYYKRENGESIRFCILYQMKELMSPDKLNSEVTQNAPQEFIDHPSFRKNCDLICLFKNDDEKTFDSVKDGIFLIEEDPYLYKKYVLYYDKNDEQNLIGAGYGDISRTVLDKSNFDEYKKNSLKSSMYSIAARIFIKLPFLELPLNEGALKPLEDEVNHAVEKEKLGNYYKLISGDIDVSGVIDGLVKNELENN